MTQQPAPGDLIGEFQRWLVRSGTRGMTRGITAQVRGAISQRGRSKDSKDVWEAATRPPQEEPPECPWCPHCRARRVLRESGPGIASQMASATETLAAMVGDAVSVFEAAVAGAGSRPADGARKPQAPAGAAQAMTDGPAAAGPPSAAGPGPAETATEPGPAEPAGGAAGAAPAPSPAGSPDEPDDRG